VEPSVPVGTVVAARPAGGSTHRPTYAGSTPFDQTRVGVTVGAVGNIDGVVVGLDESQGVTLRHLQQRGGQRLDGNGALPCDDPPPCNM